MTAWVLSPSVLILTVIALRYLLRGKISLRMQYAPWLLADCANEVEEADFNGDGETDLRWYYHGGAETYTYFRYGGRLYLAHSRSSLAQGLSTDPLPAIPAGDAVEDTGSPQLLPVSPLSRIQDNGDYTE